MRAAKNKGFTLIELAIVLGVFAVIVAGIWMVVAVVYENVHQYQANRQIQTMVQNIRQLQQRITHFDTSNLSELTASLDNQAAFPLEMRVSEGTANGNLNHPWSTSGNAVHVYSRAATEFGIEFTGLPRKVCIQIATKMSGGEITGMTGIGFNGGTPLTLTSLPLTVVGAAVQCTNALANSVEWRFTLHGE
jgi:prepilin-type N-terminal cleavage/methylation domain-containing protein